MRQVDRFYRKLNGQEDNDTRSCSQNVPSQLECILALKHA